MTVRVPAGSGPFREEWYLTEAYRRFIEAVRSGDHAACSRIIHAQLSHAQGAELAFWMAVRASTLANLSGNSEQSWEELVAAIPLSEGNWHARQVLFHTALFFAMQEQRLERFGQIVLHMREDLPWLKRAAFSQLNLGVLHMFLGQWQAARRSLSAALDGLFSMSQETQETFRIRHVHLRAWRAIAAVAVGDLAAGRADMEEAFAQAEMTDETHLLHLLLALAKAEVATAEGQYGEARAALNYGIFQNSRHGYRTASPHVLATAELLAARIARAESNQVSFAHFVGRALALAQKHQLKLTEARVRAVMAGTER